ncbi:MAG: hypothetical protein IE916_02865 [Epsilonproteobacteria bacterium]|nr:hypothetical protein [Campylobacterota bacterium]
MRTMYLSNRELAALISPLAVAGAFYFMSTPIIEAMSGYFPAYNEYTNKTLSQKTALYLQIESQYSLYDTIIEQERRRAESADWIAGELLYSHVRVAPSESLEAMQTHEGNQTVAEYTYRVELLFPKEKIALVNGKIVKEGDRIHDATILKIGSDSLLLKNKKGLQWLYLFK